MYFKRTDKHLKSKKKTHLNIMYSGINNEESPCYG